MPFVTKIGRGQTHSLLFDRKLLDIYERYGFDKTSKLPLFLFFGVLKASEATPAIQQSKKVYQKDQNRKSNKMKLACIKE